MKNFLVLLLSLFANMFHRFKDAIGASVSQNTTKGGINPKHLEYIEHETKYIRGISRIKRYSGLKKYHKVPAIQK